MTIDDDGRTVLFGFSDGSSSPIGTRSLKFCPPGIVMFCKENRIASTPRQRFNFFVVVTARGVREVTGVYVETQVFRVRGWSF